MANKPIIITQGDRGILFEVQILDKDKKPVPILGDKVYVNIVNPDNSIRTITSDDVDGVIIVSEQDGIIQFALNTLDTAQIDIHKTFYGLNTLDYDINSPNSIDYFVVARNGGNK
jgi:hypothetical protein